MNKDSYLQIRSNLGVCFEWYCAINDLKPTQEEIHIIGQYLSPQHLRLWLDEYFKCSILRHKDGRIIKVF